MTFLPDETGAVTVDWVVLTAALVGLGLATMGVVSSGVEDVSGDIDGQMQGTVISTNFTSMRHSEWYEAFSRVLAGQTAAGMTGMNSAETLIQNAIADIDEEIAEEGDAYFAYELAGYQDAFTTQDAWADLDRSTVTIAELAAVRNQSEAAVQSRIDNDFGGDTQVYYDTMRGFADAEAARTAYIMSIADERGVTY